MLEAIEAVSALGIALIGSFLLFWVVIGLVLVSMWLIPFSVLCMYEVLAMWRDVFKGLLRPLAWVVSLIGEKNDQNHRHLRISGLHMHDSRREPIFGIYAGDRDRRHGDFDVSEFLRLNK